jgi:death-on-curing family protein
MKIKSISIDAVRLIAFELAREFYNEFEPIPDFDTRYEGKLESCIAQPFLIIREKELYPSLTDKATILFYLLVKNHPFLNGNKRIAVMTLTTFLYTNNYWMNTKGKKLYNLALDTAKSKTKDKDKTMKEIKRFLEENVSKLS